MNVRRVAFPAESQLHGRLGEAFYLDAFETDLRDTALTAAQIARRALAGTPGWVEGMLRLRDALVRPLGIKTV